MMFCSCIILVTFMNSFQSYYNTVNLIHNASYSSTYVYITCVLWTLGLKESV